MLSAKVSKINKTLKCTPYSPREIFVFLGKNMNTPPQCPFWVTLHKIVGGPYPNAPLMFHEIRRYWPKHEDLYYSTTRNCNLIILGVFLSSGWDTLKSIKFGVELWLSGHCELFGVRCNQGIDTSSKSSQHHISKTLKCPLASFFH